MSRWETARVGRVFLGAPHATLTTCDMGNHLEKLESPLSHIKGGHAAILFHDYPVRRPAPRGTRDPGSRQGGEGATRTWSLFSFFSQELTFPLGGIQEPPARKSTWDARARPPHACPPHARLTHARLRPARLMPAPHARLTPAPHARLTPRSTDPPKTFQHALENKENLPYSEGR